jgi:hypothetical protein
MSGNLMFNGLKHAVAPSIDIDSGLIELTETIESPGDVLRAQFFKTVVQTRDEAIRQGLIAPGWRPPVGDPAPVIKLYVVESVQGDWLWSGRCAGQANTMQAAISRYSPGCVLAVYDVDPGSRRLAKDLG